MTDPHLLEQADQCRDRAHAYVGRPEARFLLRVAQEFERLAIERRAQTKLPILPPLSVGPD